MSNYIHLICNYVNEQHFKTDTKAQHADVFNQFILFKKNIKMQD